MIRVGTWNAEGEGPFVQAEPAFHAEPRKFPAAGSGPTVRIETSAPEGVVLTETEWLQLRAGIDALFLRDENGTIAH